MNSQRFLLGLGVVAFAFACRSGFGQDIAAADVEIISGTGMPSVSLNASSADVRSGDSSVSTAAPGFVRSTSVGVVSPEQFRPFSRVAINSRVGVAGVGFDVATPMTKRLNLRVGSDFFGYSSNFLEEGANVGVKLHMQSEHAAVDWFPFGGSFRVSPQIVFANNNRVLATAIIPAGSVVTLDGQNFVSSQSDPLRGNGAVTFRKVSPGFSVGFGNPIPRKKGRLSVPIEAGFYYVGQPGLDVSFTGSACDPSQPATIGCESVTRDADFQKSLAAFIVRNQRNLSYASFFPIFSIGFGYAF
jgi:hypothetical protein